jgi:hypothetical protein
MGAQDLTLRPRGPATFVCAGDTTLGSGSALPHGQFQAGVGMSCTSEPSRMRCSNSDGHGFTISAAVHKCSDRHRDTTAEGFVSPQAGGLSFCIATGDDLARGVRM